MTAVLAGPESAAIETVVSSLETHLGERVVTSRAVREHHTNTTRDHESAQNSLIKEAFNWPRSTTASMCGG